jgi:hypothetical protein
MPGYTKLFNRILHSTIWREDDKTRLLWITMLAMANKDGVVECTIPGLADMARISLEDCEAALDRFQKPDKYSWSKEAEGRRITVVEGGWQLINHAKYRDLLSKEDQREKTRLRVEKWRERRAVTSRNAPVTIGDDGNDMHLHLQTHLQTQDLNSKPKRQSQQFHFSLPSLGEITAYCQERNKGVDPQQFFDYYTANGWRVGRNNMKDWRAAARTWEKNGFKNGAQQNGSKTAVQLRQERNQAILERSISQIDGPTDES